MRTNAEDLAADVAELDALIEKQRERVIYLGQQIQAAKAVLTQWEALRTKLASLEQLRRTYATAEADELKWIREGAGIDF